jgi:thiamine-phosphate pyrophosphorylase
MIIHMPVKKTDQRYVYQNVIAVTNRKLCGRPFLQQVLRVCCNQPKAIILREKDMPEEEYLLLASQVRMICNLSGMKLILHKYRGVARNLGIRDIHIPLSELEDINLSGGADYDYFDQIGCSVHSVDEARRAEHLGADYLTAGHIYATDCKKGLPPRGLDFLRDVCEAVDIPVYAIGGISPDPYQIREVMEAGAKGACIMSAAMRL